MLPPGIVRSFAFSLIATGFVIAQPDFASEVKPMLERYCVECHGDEEAEGGIELHNLNTSEDAFRSFKLFERLKEVVETGDMPPFEATHELSREDEKKLLSYLGYYPQQVALGNVPRNVGRTTLRRLNRNEYNYTVRDLLGVTFRPGKNFPTDGAGGEGFDNTADALFLPPVLMERYLEASNQIVDAVYDNPQLLSRYLLAVPKKGEVSPEQAAEKVIRFFGPLAYRRRLEPEKDIQPLVALFKKAKKSGRSYEEAMRLPLTAILVNPKFLFRVQHDEKGEEWDLNQFELATRLSYFLWSSMPDRQLFQLADQRKLKDPKVMRAQVKRMLADQKSKAFVRHFAGQWIGFEELVDNVEPDVDRFPEFTFSLRASMWRESVMFVEYMVKKNRPVFDLIDADYTFLNRELASHYGISGVRHQQMKKVALLAENRQRGGMIGMGSVLTATSLPLRTSPVKRGKWIMETILGEVPPPPPDDAGELSGDDKSTEGLSFREQLEIHRKKPECASCHETIDPLGFGLENFDAIGRWRTHEINGNPVDSKAVIAGDIEFSGPVELKNLLLEAKDKFARNLTRKVLAYSLGRALEYYDEPVVDELLEQLQKGDYLFQNLIHAVVESDSFQKRSNQS